MNQGRAKFIRKVVMSKHPKVLEMIKEKFGEDKANKMTFRQVIRACKKMWIERTPGIEEWGIYKEVKESEWEQRIWAKLTLMNLSDV